MNALEAALRPIASILNRNIQATTPAREIFAELSGSVVAVRVRDTALCAYFVFHDDLLQLATSSDQDPDVVITGSLVTLALMAGQTGEAAIRRGSLDLTGDAETAQQFQRLLKYARPDVEEELSGIVGDVAAHQIGNIARGIGRWGREAGATMGENIREYLQEESRDVPSRYEVDAFTDNVSALRDDVARLEARLNRMQDRD